MGIHWDQTLKQWAEAVDQDALAKGKRVYDKIKEAIHESQELQRRQAHTIIAGSHRTSTNTKKGSDIDVIVSCHSVFSYDLPPGVTKEDVGLDGQSDYTLDMFRDDVEAALTKKFPSARITRGNKAFRIEGTPLELDADVPVFFEHRRYKNEKDQAGNYVYDKGLELRPRNDPNRRVISWPEQRFANVERRNAETSSNFVRHVRILKRLRTDMIESGTLAQREAAKPIPSYLIEGLLHNTSNSLFTLENGAYTKSAKAILDHLVESTSPRADTSKLIDMSGMLPLVGGALGWSREMMHTFVSQARARLDA